MRQTLQKIKPLVLLVRKVRSILGISTSDLNKSYHLKKRSQLIQEYLFTHQVRKLQIGAQSNSIKGWLNVDIEPKEDHVVYMDATEPFPFEDDSLDYIFTEHMIEHITFEEADFMISECARTLKKNGSIRIATPDLDMIGRVLNDPKNEKNQAYIDHYMTRFFDNEYPHDPTFVINKLFYSFHHKFIHSERSLKFLIEKHGLTYLGKKRIGESDDPNLSNLEQHWREMGEIPNEVETLIVEAKKNA